MLEYSKVARVILEHVTMGDCRRLSGDEFDTVRTIVDNLPVTGDDALAIVIMNEPAAQKILTIFMDRFQSAIDDRFRGQVAREPTSGKE